LAEMLLFVAATD